MEPISGMIPGAIPSLSTVAGVKEPPKVQRFEDKTQGSPLTPARDEYVPEEKQEPSGRYWLGRDEDGQPKICFDDPEQVVGVSEKQRALPYTDGPDQDKRVDGSEKKAAGNKAESCTGSTDQVDREIEKLKKRQEELERQLRSETDDTKIKALKRKLAQIESELRQKDNDTYRRQHSTFSESMFQ